MINSTYEYESCLGAKKIMEDKIREDKPSDITFKTWNYVKNKFSEDIEKIEVEINYYENNLKSESKIITIGSLESIFSVPVRCRTMLEMSVKDFSNYVGVHKRQISRYEKSNYDNCSTLTFKKIMLALSLHIKFN
jgi:hypothetical protein